MSISVCIYVACVAVCVCVCVCVCETLEFHAIKFAFLEQLLEFLGFDKIRRQ